MPPDVLSRELGENVQNVRALEPVHPMNHQEPNVQKQPSAERQWSNQTRERTIQRAEEPPIQRPRLENPASSIRWSRVNDEGHWVLPRLWKMRKTCGPKRTLRCCCGSSKSTITSGTTMGSLPVCVKKSGMSSSAVPVKTSRHRMTRGDELPHT